MAVDITLTENIRNAIIEAIRRNYLPRDLENQLSKYSEDRLSRNESDSRETRVPIIPFKLVKQLWEYQQLATTGQDFSSKQYLHELLAGSEIYVEPLRLPEKSAELIARLNKLKAEQEKAEYNRMVTNVDRKRNQRDELQLGQEIRSGSKQLASITNFILSIVATFAFGYVASQFAFPSEAMRVVIGILMAFIVAIAELYFMARVEI